jgi:hypothetical protein
VYWKKPAPAPTVVLGLTVEAIIALQLPESRVRIEPARSVKAEEALRLATLTETHAKEAIPDVPIVMVPPFTMVKLLPVILIPVLVLIIFSLYKVPLLAIEIAGSFPVKLIVP